MHQFVFERSVVDGSETNVCAEKNGAAIGGESLELVDAGLHHMGGCDWVGTIVVQSESVGMSAVCWDLKRVSSSVV